MDSFRERVIPSRTTGRLGDDLYGVKSSVEQVCYIDGASMQSALRTCTIPIAHTHASDAYSIKPTDKFQSIQYPSMHQCTAVHSQLQRASHSHQHMPNTARLGTQSTQAHKYSSPGVPVA